MSESDQQRMFTVVIPTHNRRFLVARAIESVYAAGWEDVEIIVVDDASDDDTPEVIASTFPMVQMLRIDNNSGPGVARNLGIDAAKARWILMLDDDDLLKPDALKIIQEVLDRNPELARYPVIQFACNSGNLESSFLAASLEDYINGRLQGDFTPLIQTRVFKNAQLRYPNCRVGGESLLWLEIARSWGIPSHSSAVVRVTRDAPSNLCSTQSQLARPRDYAELQEQTLARFGKHLFGINPAYYRKKVIGGIVYRLLAGDRALARATISRCAGVEVRVKIALRCLSYLPLAVIRPTFKLLRFAGR
jgi:glycosyltransferase involved in cell wall biosynthesis